MSMGAEERIVLILVGDQRSSARSYGDLLGFPDQWSGSGEFVTHLDFSSLLCIWLKNAWKLVVSFYQLTIDCIAQFPSCFEKCDAVSRGIWQSCIFTWNLTQQCEEFLFYMLPIRLWTWSRATDFGLMFDILRFLADQVKEVRRIGNKSGVIKSESLIFLRSKDYHLLFTSLKNQTCEKATFTFPYAKYFRGGFFAHFPQMGKKS